MANNTQRILSAIVAMSTNRVIGVDNQLPWHLPADLRHFKAITTGKTILMGRKTHQSIGRVLPHRTNLILTRDQTFLSPGCVVIHSLDEAWQHTADHEIIVIGGAEIYQQLLPKITRLYLTVVHHNVDGDAFFPELEMTEWLETAKEEHAADQDNPYPYTFFTYERTSTN